jgi:pyridoxamine 5'-phosphate oxidase
VGSRVELEAAARAVEARFTGGDVPRPAFWGGFRLRPERVEFWLHRDDRLHDRVEYRPDGERWTRYRLQP